MTLWWWGAGNCPPLKGSMALVSVIIPCFNYGRYLPDAIHSLMGGPTSLGEFTPQTLQDFDITLVDDASPDDTYSFAEPFLCERISYIRNPENLGTATALNVGIKQATGKYITFLSADDMMETTRLEKLVNAAESNPHRLVYDDLKTFKDGQRQDTMPLMAYDFDKLLYKNIMHAGILYPRQAWVESGGYPEQFRDGREDWAFNLRLGVFGWCGVHVKEPLYLYRREGQNRSLHNGGTDNRIMWLKKMQQLYPDLYRGEKTTMCCGNKSKPKTVAASKSRSAPTRNQYVEPIYSESGMVLVEYQLPKAGKILYTGAVTGRQYAFSSAHKRNNVDVRDAPALLQRIEDRRRAFLRVDAEPPAPVGGPTIAPDHTDPTAVEITPVPFEPVPEKKSKKKQLHG